MLIANWLVWWSLPMGVALDALLGDPRGWPHPVRLIGTFIAEAERAARSILARLGGGAVAECGAGIAMATVVVGLTGGAVWGVVAVCDALGPAVSFLGRSLLISWGLAAKSLGDETLRASDAPDLATARRELSWIVGRDTETLDWPEVSRACVETVAENCSDAVVAPLFWYAVGGPVGLWAFKASSTLDSMVGYRNPRHLRLGWASARLDDFACLVPARLTWLLIALAAALVRERPASALKIGWRDGRKHPSPNAGWGESAMAGALAVRLGGASTYGGTPSTKPWLGDPGEVIGPATVRRAVGVMRVAGLLAAVLTWGVRARLLGLP